MKEFENEFSRVATLIGDRARSAMLWNLMDGRAYTATELSLCADISAQSASNHLSKLVNANILAVERQGRHRYYRFANSEAAQVIESMTSLMAFNKDIKKIGRPGIEGITYARTCYDHLAGKAGVEITGSLIKNGIIKTSGKNYEVSRKGNDWFGSIGIDIEEVKLHKRSFAHQCLDWSERKHHLAGALGASLLRIMLKKDWIRKRNDTREVTITPKGKIELKKLLDLDI